MKLLITGGNGYVGSHVVKVLLDQGHEVWVCDVMFDAVDARAIKVNTDIFHADEELYEKLGAPDVCLHLAWRNGFVHNAKTQMGDLSAHYNFLTSMIDGGLKHLAVMGTMHEVGYWEGAIDETTPCNPLSQYGIAKVALRRSMTLYCNDKGVTLQWLRGYYIFGDDQRNHSIFTKLCDAELQGKDRFPFTTGRTKYDFISVDELASQIAAVITQTEINGIINCCSGIPVSLAEKIENYIQVNNMHIKLDYGKYPDRPYDSPIIYGDATKIHQILDNLRKNDNVRN